ncbi:hypothetical protein KPH14_012596 [Odynerus spinipes]|uniref:SAP domain-containing protein n=1 Tax=Odynerus spinipes TaxID=1348599 RepID=A0AAD9VKN8_9HYME|nr:hypothetical protein KPH14_012596 [Odynerus spinipes]
MFTKGADDFTVVELKEILRQCGLNTSGAKAELIARLYDHDPSGRWLSVGDAEEGAVGGTNVDKSASDGVQSLRELELLRREKARMERELEIIRCELEATRNSPRTMASEEERPTTTMQNV